MKRSLDMLFRPRSIAVIGASRRRGTIAGEIFHNLIACGFSGVVYPVNPSTPFVQSVRAYPNMRALPEPVDLAIVVVPAAQVPQALDDCIASGVRGVVVITAGFGEISAEGRARQDALLAKVRAAGMRMVGPNCFGLINTAPDIGLNATFSTSWPPHGSVAFSSQSGALGQAVLDHAKELGIGISQFISVGNKADVSGNDLLEYWEDDDQARVILLYLESFGNPRRFMEVASRVARKKPVVLVKSGRTEAGARAASSHTGSLAGLDVAVDALLGQAGVVRTDTIEALFDVAMLLASQPVPRGPRVGVVTNAGGPAIMAVDACESRGLRMASLAPETEAALRAFLPPEASVRNPVDMIASATAQSYEKAIALLLADANVDSVIALFVPPLITEAADVARAIRTAAATTDKPVLTCFMGTHGIPEGVSSLREGHFPSYAFPESAAIALSHAVRYGQLRARPVGHAPELRDVDAAAARAVLTRGGPGPRWLNPDDVREVLRTYGVSTPASALAKTAREAAAAAERIGFPVALKLVSATITHKTEVGGVALNLMDAAAVTRAFDAMADNLAREGRAGAMDGVLVQEMVTGGVETFVGVTHDASFGALLGFGIGGVQIEVWKDVVFRVAPLTDIDAREMLEGIRGRKLLEGYRGAPAVDLAALQDVILRVSRLAADLPEVRELDINPLLARTQGATALDARIRVG